MLEKEMAKFDLDEARELQLIKDSHATLKPAVRPIVIPLPSEKFGH
jgi:hypothetical protein